MYSKELDMRTLSVVSLIYLFMASPSWSQPTTISVSVTRFQQEVGHIYEHCQSWHFTEQNQLRTELERQLSLNGLKVLERRDIRTIYENEYELQNLNQKTVNKRNQFITAKYTVTGGISELGICDTSSHSGVRLGGIVSLLGGPDVDLGVKKQSSVSKVKVVAQIVSVETGEVVKTFEALSEINDSSYKVEGGYHGLGGSHGSKTRPPIERATNEAIRELATKIAGYLLMTSCEDCDRS
jgi:curli biogenesis system outer membrane secretion channel CsgG